MRKDLNRQLSDLGDMKTKFFCGSASLMSTKIIIKGMEKDIQDFKHIFNDYDKLLDRLYVEDCDLFDYSRKAVDLTDTEWNQVITTFNDYVLYFRGMKKLISVCSCASKTRYLSPLKLNYDFISEICSMSIDGFINREDKPESFMRVVNDILQETRGI